MKNIYPIAVIVLLLLIAGALLFASRWNTYNSSSSIDENRFTKMVQANMCAESYDFFTIDDKMVFWTWNGLCQDYGFGNVLFGITPENILCQETDSLGGSKKQCNDLEKQALFDIINIHKKEPNLGLDSTHRVEKFDSKRKTTF